MPAHLAADAVSQPRGIARLAAAILQPVVLVRPFFGPGAAALHPVAARLLAVVVQLGSELRRRVLSGGGCLYAPPNRHQPNKDDHSWEAVKAVIAHGEQHDARPDAQCARFHAHPWFTPAPTRAENQPSSRSHSITRLRRHLNNRSAPLIGLIAIEAKDKQANS